MVIFQTWVHPFVFRVQVFLIRKDTSTGVWIFPKIFWKISNTLRINDTRNFHRAMGVSPVVLFLTSGLFWVSTHYPWIQRQIFRWKTRKGGWNDAPLKQGSGNGFYLFFHPQAPTIETLFHPVLTHCQERGRPWFTIFSFPTRFLKTLALKFQPAGIHRFRFH